MLGSEQREALSLRVVEPGENAVPTAEKKGFREGTIGIYAPGALGVAMAHNLGTDQFITRAGGRSAEMFAERTNLRIVTGDGSAQTESVLQGQFSNGLVQAYRSGCLPEVVLASPNADKVSNLVDELVELTYTMAQDGLLHMDSNGELRGLDRLPAIVLASNGILDESLRAQVKEAMNKIVQAEQTGEALSAAWWGKIVRGLSYVSAERTGFGPAAVYKPPKSGVVTLSGGMEQTRKRIAEITKDRGSVRFIDRGENPVEQEWRKAYTNLMTNVVGLELCSDRRRSRPRLDLPVGRLLQRMKPANGVTYIEVEGADETCERLGKAFFAIAQKKGLFTTYETWEEFNQKVFLDPIKNPADFYAHVPSSLQMVANQLEAGRLPDGVPPNEANIIASLLAEAKKYSGQSLDGAVGTLLRTTGRIKENIVLLKEIYRRPQVGEPVAGTIRRVFNQTGEVVNIGFQPENLGLSPEEVQRYVTKAVDIDYGDESVVPMTAEVFTYGPKQIPGNVAFITNGAGFTLEALDRCAEAGVRLGFVSDLRLQFEEGKYYLAMKMALAANPVIDTVAIDVLTTLGTSIDVARAVERIVREYPQLKFVIKVEGRDQEQGIEMLQKLKTGGLPIIFTQDEENLPASQVHSLTLDQLVQILRRQDGMDLDETYARYERLEEAQLEQMMEFALAQRYRQLLIPMPVSGDNAAEITALGRQGILSPNAVFGKEFRSSREGESLVGQPVVVIAGYGETPRLQAKLMKKAGTEVVLLHPQIHNKVKPEDLKTLHDLGIRTYTSTEELHTDFNRAYPQGVDLIGICYEPYKPEVEDGGYRERVERAVDSLIELKTAAGLQVVSILIPTEMIPTVGTKSILAKCREAGIWFIGPNSPGMSRVDKQVFAEYSGAHLKVAQIPKQCVRSGDIAVAGVGGTMLFETLNQFASEGKGISWAISLGGDRTRGLSARDAVLVAENDPNTNFMVYIGEPGGNAAQELAEVMAAGLITKPVIVKIIGRRLPDQCFVGHAGSVIYGGDFERTTVKIDALRQAGAIIVDTPEQMSQTIGAIEENQRYGRIDTASAGFRTAQTVMRNLIEAQNAVIDGLLKQ